MILFLGEITVFGYAKWLRITTTKSQLDMPYMGVISLLYATGTCIIIPQINDLQFY